MATRQSSTAVWGDRVLDAVVAVLATWTVVYHVSLLLRLGVWPAVALEVVALAAYATLARRLDGPRSGTAGPGAQARTALPDAPDTAVGAPPRHRDDRAALAVTLVAAAVAALGMATSAPWPLVWLPWLAAGVAGTWWAWRRLGSPTPGPESNGRVDDLVVLGWAVAAAVLSAWIIRPNPDDLYYLNLSQWVAEHGSFPLRDTIFANLVYPMSNWPPVASYDGLVGAVAHLAGVRAGSVEYVVVPPLATLLSVLALGRLLRSWRVRRLGVVVSVAMLFLLLDGTSSYGSPGNLFLTRLWQGKVILLCLLVPTLLVYALRYVDRPDRAGALRLFAGGAAAVGLSTTAMFLTPVLALAGMAPLVRRAPARAAAGFAATAAYPLAAGLATLLLGGRSADDFASRKLFRFDASWIGHEVFLTGVLAAVAVLAVLLGALLVPHPAARVTTGLLSLATGAVLVPGATRLAYDVTGLGPTLWRISWGCTVAALVGVLVGRAASALRHRWARYAALVATAAVLVAAGSPIWAASTNSRWQAPFHWQRSDSSRALAARLIAASRPGELLLAPNSLAITVDVTTTDVKTVAPRDYYMHYLRHDPSFHYRDRLALVHFVNDVGPWDPAVVARATRVLDVGIACVHRDDTSRQRALRRADFTTLTGSSYYLCMKAG